MNASACTGALVRHPVAVAALVMLFVNDQLLKERFANAVTGKLSDIAGLVLAPIVLVSVLELCSRRTTGVALMVACTALTVVAFALVQLWWPAGELYERVFGLLRWPLDATAALISGGAHSNSGRVQLWRDATDLLALPACVVPVWLAVRRAGSQDGQVTVVGQPAVIGS